MTNTTLKQKILLIAAGIVLTALLLEIALRIAGGIVIFLQERRNHMSLSSNEYRILCLGESTTALGDEDSYPSQLEVVLDNQTKNKKYTVINKGIISTTTDHILAQLDENLEVYKPRIVILMMGINDKAYMHEKTKVAWWENFKYGVESLRIYKLLHLIYEHTTHRIKEINTPKSEALLPQDPPKIEKFLKFLILKSASQNNFQIASSACVELADRYRLENRIQDALGLLQQAHQFEPNDPDIYEEAGEIYLTAGKSGQAAFAFESALKIDPHQNKALLGLAHAFAHMHNDNAVLAYGKYLQMNPNDYWVMVEFGQWLIQSGHDDVAKLYLERAITIGPAFDQAYLDLGKTLDEEHLYTQEKDMYIKAISDNPQGARLYAALGELYQRQGQQRLAKECFQKQAREEMSEYYPVTLVNYDLALNKILKRHIIVIVMQYPMRSITALKDYLGQRPNVIYVENRQNFKRAVLAQGFHHYFKDNFALDFGHCTRAGNELIANNLAKVILNQ